MIELSDLTKKFDTFTAVDHLNLRIETGEFFGLLGPNGAGKTTTISLMSTLLLPTEGEIRVDGEVLSRKNPRLKRKISVITQEYSMRQDMTMDEVMEYQGRLYFMPRKKIREKTEELTGILRSDRFSQKDGTQAFRWYEAELMVCRALLTEPEILLLDEPTAGFDPVFRKDFTGIIQDIRDREIGVLMSTHIISDIDQIADYIMLIDDGELKFSKTREALGNHSIQELIEQCGHKKTTVRDLLRRE